jgi:hypothetical protein
MAIIVSGMSGTPTHSYWSCSLSIEYA